MLVVAFIQRITIQGTVVQLTQSNRKAFMQLFINVSAFAFCCSKWQWALEWDYASLILI